MALLFFSGSPIQFQRPDPERTSSPAGMGALRPMLNAALATQIMYYGEHLKGDNRVEESHTFSHRLVSSVKEAASFTYGSCTRHQAKLLIKDWGEDIRARWVSDNLHLSITLDIDKLRDSQVCCSDCASV